MAVAAERSGVVPLVERFVDDCETPVSAFLKLRAAFEGPAYLLESAEQGRLGRYSFLGLRPERTLRWSLGDDGDPYRRGRRAGGRLRGGRAGGAAAVPRRRVGFFGYDLVRTVERLADPNPDPLGLPDMALMVCELMLVFDHLKHELERDRVPLRVGRRCPGRWSPRPGRRCARPCPGPRPPPADAAGVRVEHEPRGVRGQRLPDRRVRPRRRRLPGRALAAVQRTRPGRGVLDLPRPADGQPVSLHVLPRLRGLPARRRFARAADQGLRPARRDPADRGHLSPRRQRGGGPPQRRGALGRSRRSAPST